jgi:hypothetical protein
MSQKPSSSPTPTRPYLLDYWFLLAGFGLSLYLLDLNPLTVEPLDAISNQVLRAWIEFLPRLMRLPEGVVLFFRSFFSRNSCWAAVRRLRPANGCGF